MPSPPWRPTRSATTLDSRTQDREILRLAVPAFLALVAEPLFLLADAAIIGHLGTPHLAGLGIAGAIIQTAVGMCIFLAYGTTASVARRVGAGDPRGALTQGVDGIWLAVLIGVPTTAVGVAATPSLVDLFGADSAVSGYAVDYLRLAFLGFAPLLVMLAATGVLRGLQDTRTPLYVAVAANVVNVVLNVVLVYGLDLGIAGAAIGSVLAQLAAAVALVVVVVRAARSQGASLRPDLPGIGRAAHAGVALVVRTLTLRASLLVMTYGAASLGAVPMASHQLAVTAPAARTPTAAATGRSTEANDSMVTTVSHAHAAVRKARTAASRPESSAPASPISVVGAGATRQILPDGPHGTSGSCWDRMRSSLASSTREISRPPSWRSRIVLVSATVEDVRRRVPMTR